MMPRNSVKNYKKMYVHIQDGCHVVGQITLKKFKNIFTMLL